LFVDIDGELNEIISRRGETRAQALGNLEHSKTWILFEDNQSKKMVETTVWAVTDESVILKRGVGIPINRIFMTF
jgi:hypothetical protein